MAPEQIMHSSRVDARRDLYALGVVLFECLTGRRACDATTPPELARQVVFEEPPMLATLRPDLPAALTEAVDRCLQKRPIDRFGTAREVCTALLAAGV